MPFKLSVRTVLVAITAGTSAFGAAYNLAIGDQVVSGWEWASIAWATLTTVIGTFYHQPRQVWSDNRRRMEAWKAEK